MCCVGLSRGALTITENILQVKSIKARKRQSLRAKGKPLTCVHCFFAIDPNTEPMLQIIRLI